ncbi:MAG: nucleotidyltransferase family protein [Candidatus Margulisiibacteriota bacterium]
MKTSHDIMNILISRRPEISGRFRIREIGLFGSYAKGTERGSSDVDILVDFEDGFKTFDNYMELKFYLEDFLMCKVDLVLKGALKKRLSQRILSEVKNV